MKKLFIAIVIILVLNLLLFGFITKDMQDKFLTRKHTPKEQKKYFKKNDEEFFIKNDDKLILYRNYPAKYFEIVRSKQLSNATNIHVKFHDKNNTYEYWRKNNIERKKVCYNPSANGSSCMQTISHGKFIYIFTSDVNDKPLAEFAAKSEFMCKQDDSCDVAKETFYVSDRFLENSKFEYGGQYYHKGNLCSVWFLKNTKKPDNNSHTEICVDENLGISYYMRIKTNERTIDLYNIDKLELGVVQDQDLTIPSTIKKITNADLSATIICPIISSKKNKSQFEKDYLELCNDYIK